MLDKWSRVTLMTLGTTCAVVVGTTVVYLYKKWKGNDISRLDFVEVGKIEKIFIYPVKSLGGVEVEYAACTKLGLKCGHFNDRSWLVVRENGHFITLRQQPTMALIQPSLCDKELWLDAPGMETLKVLSIEKVTDNDIVLMCNVWGDNISAVDCGEEAAKWFQQYLKQPGIRLVQYCNSMKPRGSPPKGALLEYDPKKYPTVFCDEASYMLLNEASVDELNQRIEDEEEKVTYQHFRPNFLVSGTIPFQEDEWKYVQIGDATFVQLKPCARCLVTTVNPATGKKSEKNEPLKTLRKFRLTKNEKLKRVLGQSPLMGICMGLEVEGGLKVGATVYAVLSPSTV